MKNWTDASDLFTFDVGVAADIRNEDQDRVLLKFIPNLDKLDSWIIAFTPEQAMSIATGFAQAAIAIANGLESAEETHEATENIMDAYRLGTLVAKQPIAPVLSDIMNNEDYEIIGLVLRANCEEHGPEFSQVFIDAETTQAAYEVQRQSYVEGNTEIVLPEG